MRYLAKYNTVYRPRLTFFVHWTFRGKTHYLTFGK